MTAQQIVKIVSAVAASLDTVLFYADKMKDIPAIPGWLSHSWGGIFLGIVAIDRGLHAYLGDTPPAFPKGSPAAIISAFPTINPVPAVPSSKIP